MNYKNGDFTMYYDDTQKRNIWVLGYFGGGSINFKAFEEVAKDFSKIIGVPLDTIHIDEIFNSRRYKGFKFIYSKEDDQSALVGSTIMSNVYEFLTS